MPKNYFGFGDGPLAIEAIRDGLRDLDRRFAVGLITFPSVHAGAGVIMAWAYWGTPIRWPMQALNVVMIISAIMVGEHYLVDILAGIALGAATIYAVHVLRPLRAPSWASRVRVAVGSKAL